MTETTWKTPELTHLPHLLAEMVPHALLISDHSLGLTSI